MANKKNLNWSTTNAKLRKDGIISFNIPAGRSQKGFKTCPKAGACLAVCYAQQGAYRFPNSIKAREENLISAIGKDFAKDAIADLKRFKADKVRIHDSGDFFNQKYLNAWIKIATATPTKQFYAYTKSLHLNFDKMPENMRVTQSEGGLMDKHINKKESHSRIFATEKARIKAGYENGNESDMLAVNGVQKIGLVYHGGKHLTEKQAKHFS